MEKENNTLNLCEKLAGCPKGTKLWSPLFGECEFAGLTSVSGREPYDRIDIVCDEVGLIDFDQHGHFFPCLGERMLFPSRENRDWDSWECPKPKPERFDPETFQPFDRMLVRDEDDDIWRCDFFERLKKEGCSSPVAALVASWMFCIPYNDDTKHLLGTTDDAPEYYRWWEA